MRFTINTKEFKTVMALVATVAENSANVRMVAHNVCLLHALPDANQLKLEFSLNDSFLTYTFNDVVFYDAKSDVTQSVDLSSLALLKFSGSTIELTLDSDEQGSTLGFSSGILEGKLLVSHIDVVKDVERNRPDPSQVPLTHVFSTSTFLSALSAHNYGMHHNAMEALRRPVRIYNRDGKLFFVSCDKITAAFFSKNDACSFDNPDDDDGGSIEHTSDEFSYYLLPKPLQSVLKKLSTDGSPTFQFGMSKKVWRLTHGNIEVYFPNIIPEANFDLEDLVRSVNAQPGYFLMLDPEKLHNAIVEMTPFAFSKQLVIQGKDMPITRLVSTAGNACLTLNTSKAKDVTVFLDVVEAQLDGFDASENLMFNFKHLSECVASLITSEEKTKESTPIYLRWWSITNSSAPTKGKTLCIQRGDNYYWISRIRESAQHQDV